MVRDHEARPDADEPLVAYDVDAAERLSDAILRASDLVIDDLVSVRPLASIIDIDSVDNLFETHRGNQSNPAERVIAFAAWDLWFVVTGSAVEIYELNNPFDG